MVPLEGVPVGVNEENHDEIDNVDPVEDYVGCLK